MGKSSQPFRIHPFCWRASLIVATLALLIPVGAIADQSRANSEQALGFRLIVHPGNPAEHESRTLIADLFLKKVTRWSNGTSARPVDQRPDTGVRRRFSETVLKRTVEAVRRFWQQKIFSGRDLPPPELDSDQAVVAFVESHPGAVGYVSVDAKLGRTRELTVK